MNRNESKLRYVFSSYILIIGTVGQFAPYLQAFKTFSSQSASDLSVIASIVGLISVVSWLFYGLMIKDYPLIISCSVGFLGTILVIVGIFLYG